MARTVPFRRTLTEELRNSEFAREYLAELERLRIAEQLAKAREAAGLTQGQLAQRMRTSQPAVARMERGDYRGYTLASLSKAAYALGRRLRVELIPSSGPRAAHAKRAAPGAFTVKYSKKPALRERAKKRG
jgi:transcriptional regulator with XRE-family HTH domain